jgi:hypothetical protein
MNSVNNLCYFMILIFCWLNIFMIFCMRKKQSLFLCDKWHFEWIGFSNSNKKCFLTSQFTINLSFSSFLPLLYLVTLWTIKRKNGVFFKLMENSFLKRKYRIYSHTSREILDKIWQKFYQFDLYAGHKKYLPKCTKITLCIYQNFLLRKIKLLKFQILDTFCQFSFQFDLYASIYGNASMVKPWIKYNSRSTILL